MPRLTPITNWRAFRPFMEKLGTIQPSPTGCCSSAMPLRWPASISLGLSEFLPSSRRRILVTSFHAEWTESLGENLAGAGRLFLATLEARADYPQTSPAPEGDLSPFFGRR